MKYITFFTESTPNPTLVGGKGLNILKLGKIKVNIPPGFIVNTNAYKKFIEKSSYHDQLIDLFSKNVKPKDILNHSKELKSLIIRSRFPEYIKKEIKEVFDEINNKLKKKISYAVRSSATIEDSKAFSFAGQAESFLNNKNFDEILLSLKNCWSSLFSPQALLYLLQMKKKGIDFSLLNISMAVVVQEMINSEVSGVLFTTNVLDNNTTQMLINATWGLGETVTDNLVVPDMIILNKSEFNIVRYDIGKKEKRSIQNPNGSGTILIENDQNSGSFCSLTTKQLYQLYDLGLKLENEFSYPQDIEWAIQNEVIYVLQTRPITTLKNKS